MKTDSFRSIMDALFEEGRPFMNIAVFGMLGKSQPLIADILTSKENLKLGKSSLIDIIAYLRPKEGSTSCGILTTAIEHSNLVALAALIQHGAKINEQCEHGRTPLHFAAINTQVGAQAIDLLMKHRGLADFITRNVAQINGVDKEGDNPFLLAVQTTHPNLNTLQALINHGTKVNQRKLNPVCYTKFPPSYCIDGEGHNQTPLHLALNRKDLDVQTVDFLLKQGALPNDVVYHKGPTPLSIAIRQLSEGKCDLKIIERLLKYGADPKLMSGPYAPFHDMSSLHHLSYQERNQEIQLFLEKGGDPNQLNEDQETPFGLYAQLPILDKGHLEGLPLFSQYQVDFNVLIDGKTPLDYVNEEDAHFPLSIAFLSSKGALTSAELLHNQPTPYRC